MLLSLSTAAGSEEAHAAHCAHRNRSCTILGDISSTMRDTLRDIARRQPPANNNFSEADDEKTEVGSQRGHASVDKPNDYRYADEKGRSTPPSGDPSQEDPFADDENSDTRYRTLSWWQASIIMIAETISLGILSLPSVLATLGFVPGVILIVGLGIVATYTGYVIGQFKMRYPFVHSMADAGWVLCKPLGCPRVGREIGGAAQTIFLIFSMGVCSDTYFLRDMY